MKLVINQDWCKVCGICESVCPAKAIRISHGRVEIDEEQCVTCRICMDYCPDMAIDVRQTEESKL